MENNEIHEVQIEIMEKQNEEDIEQIQSNEIYERNTFSMNLNNSIHQETNQENIMRSIESTPNEFNDSNESLLRPSTVQA